MATASAAPVGAWFDDVARRASATTAIPVTCIRLVVWGWRRSPSCSSSSWRRARTRASATISRRGLAVPRDRTAAGDHHRPGGHRRRHRRRPRVTRRPAALAPTAPSDGRRTRRDRRLRPGRPRDRSARHDLRRARRRPVADPSALPVGGDPRRRSRIVRGRQALGVAGVAAQPRPPAGGRRPGGDDRRDHRTRRGAAGGRRRHLRRRRRAHRPRRPQPPPEPAGRRRRTRPFRLGGDRTHPRAGDRRTVPALPSSTGRWLVGVRQGLRPGQPGCRPPVPQLPHGGAARRRRRVAGHVVGESGGARRSPPPPRPSCRRALSRAARRGRPGRRIGRAGDGGSRRTPARHPHRRGVHRRAARRGVARDAGAPRCGHRPPSAARRQRGRHRRWTVHRRLRQRPSGSRRTPAGVRPRRARRVARRPRRCRCGDRLRRPHRPHWRPRRRHAAPAATCPDGSDAPAGVEVVAQGRAPGGRRGDRAGTGTAGAARAGAAAHDRDDRHADRRLLLPVAAAGQRRRQRRRDPRRRTGDGSPGAS